MSLLSIFDGVVGRLDELYFRYHCHVNRGDPAMFHRGWGSHEAIAEVNRHWMDEVASAPLVPGWESEWRSDEPGLWVRSGTFPTPCYREHLPRESQLAGFHLVRPSPVLVGPTVVLMPTSREAGVAGRMPLARCLAGQGIASVLLESPFMGRRKPAAQQGRTLSSFSDFLVLSAVSIEEARSVLDWLAALGVMQLGVAGISKGGYLAAVAGLRSRQRPHVVAFLPPHSGVAVLLDGLLGRLCDWETLQRTSGSATPVRVQIAEVFEHTSLQRLPRPGASQRLTLVGARKDRYVPRYSYETMQQHWHDCAEMRWLAGGHVSSIADRRPFCEAVSALFTPA